MKRTGFTLIELLIVVAIIGILAAIAVPNFLNAQIRAKVAQSVTDMKTIANGYEMYRIEFNSYPNDHDSDEWMDGRQHGLFSLTSPISFLTVLPCDPFIVKHLGQELGISSNAYDDHGICGYPIGSGADNSGRQHKQAYMIVGYGPDLIHQAPTLDPFPFGTAFLLYDASNGLKSHGDLLNKGGDYRSGCYLIFGETNGWEGSGCQ